MAIYNNRVCKFCGKTFSGGPRAWYCPECRYERKKQTCKEYRQRKAMGNSRKIGEEYICENCGQKYILVSGLQMYCEKCQPEMHKKIDNEQGKVYYHERVDKAERSVKRQARYAKNKDKINAQRREANRVKPKPPRPPRDPVKSICELCGAEIRSERKRRFCDTCKKEKLRTYQREWASQHRSNKKSAGSESN